jgi:hypothetical protein
MKIQVIESEYVDPSALFEDEQLINLRHLMNMGCWGTLEVKPHASWLPLADHLAASLPQDYSRVVLGPLPDLPDDHKELDERIGSQLESTTDDTIVLVICTHAEKESGCFVLAAPNSALTGRLDGVRVADIVATLLVLAGLPPIPGSQGVSLTVPVEPGDKVDEDEMIRERLRGLGYIA